MCRSSATTDCCAWAMATCPPRCWTTGCRWARCSAPAGGRWPPASRCPTASSATPAATTATVTPPLHRRTLMADLVKLAARLPAGESNGLDELGHVLTEDPHATRFLLLTVRVQD